MSGPIDGGPAFPITGVDYAGKPMTKASGMSLRDWFAGQALIGMMQNMRPYSSNFVENAASAYAQADEMLAEREKAKP